MLLELWCLTLPKLFWQVKHNLIFIGLTFFAFQVGFFAFLFLGGRILRINESCPICWIFGKAWFIWWQLKWIYELDGDLEVGYWGRWYFDAGKTHLIFLVKCLSCRRNCRKSCSHVFYSIVSLTCFRKFSKAPLMESFLVKLQNWALTCF